MMNIVRIKAGGMTRDFSSTPVVKKVDFRETREVPANDVSVGDVILLDNHLVKVTDVQSVVIDLEHYKGTRESCSCFPAEARVITKDRGLVPLSRVTTGTSLLTLDPLGIPVYSPVYLMAHADPSATIKCIQIKTEGATLELTGGHFVLIVDSQGQERYVTAREVKLGHKVKVYDDTKEAFRLSPVTSLGLVERRGRFAPFTLVGSVVVEGVAASCYEETCRVSPCWAHVLLAPVRWAWRLSPPTFALLSSPRDLKGLPAWVSWLMPRVLPLLPNMNSA